MKIYIPSRGRFSGKPLNPLRFMPSTWVDDTFIVVHSDEKQQYIDALKKMLGEGQIEGSPTIINFEYDGIADKRTKIGQDASLHGFKTFMMIDDDLNFLKRVDSATVNQQTISDKNDIHEMLSDVDEYLNIYPQVGLGMREGNNHAGVGPRPLPIEIGKAIRAVGYQTDIFRSVDTNRVRTMSDYDTTLQILEAGHKNVVLHWWMSGQRGTNTPGGCALWRTHQVHEESVKRMAELHPGICRPRLKENKTGGEFGTRMELTIGWKKAYRGD